MMFHGSSKILYPSNLYIIKLYYTCRVGALSKPYLGFTRRDPEQVYNNDFIFKINKMDIAVTRGK